MELNTSTGYIDFTRTAYETLLAALRTDVQPTVRERLVAELKCRDRAMFNQFVEVCGGEFK